MYKELYHRRIISGRWQAPAAVLPMAQRQLTEGPRTKGTATRGPEGPESGKNMRARGRAKLSARFRRLPVLLYVFHDSAKNRDFHGTI